MGKCFWTRQFWLVHEWKNGAVFHIEQVTNFSLTIFSQFSKSKNERLLRVLFPSIEIWFLLVIYQRFTIKRGSCERKGIIELGKIDIFCSIVNLIMVNQATNIEWNSFQTCFSMCLFSDRQNRGQSNGKSYDVSCNLCHHKLEEKKLSHAFWCWQRKKSDWFHRTFFLWTAQIKVKGADVASNCVGWLKAADRLWCYAPPRKMMDYKLMFYWDFPRKSTNSDSHHITRTIHKNQRWSKKS